ncbi:hypothetical protein BDW75DRAFT_225842, partial [Aspergillus navahoensis]
MRYCIWFICRIQKLAQSCSVPLVISCASRTLSPTPPNAHILHHCLTSAIYTCEI